MKDDFSFYESTPLFHDFREVMNPKNYHPVPDNWVVVITDIKGSTVHIENGRYKDINMIGASTIIAVINSLPGKTFPYVFGGDGATMLLPFSALETIKPALYATQKMAKERFDFDLRIGAVSIGELRKAGADTLVGRHQIADNSNLAMIRGGGTSVADKWIKQEPKYLLTHEGATDSPILDLFAGLQCRWQPLQNRNGTVLSILVRSLQGDNVYIRILEQIRDIIGHDDNNMKPSSPRQMRLHWPLLQGITNEMKVHSWNRGFLGLIAYFLKLNIFIPLLKAARFFNFNLLNNFSMRRYVDELVASTDYRKFDDILRMVVDVSPTQAKAISEYLKERKVMGELIFGIHASDSALMTCLVFSANQHIHFVDGAHGGYTLASKQLKSS